MAIKTFTFEPGSTVELDESAMTLKVIGVLRGQPLPGQVFNLQLVEADDSFVSVQWFDSGDAATWKVYRDDGLLNTVAVPSYTDSTVAANTDYVYHVIATNPAGDGVASEDLAVHTPTGANPAPDPPTNLGYFSEDGGSSATFIHIKWDNPGSVADWTVKRNTVTVATVTAPDYKDTDVVPSTSYDYEVIANNSAGASGPSAFTGTTLANNGPEWTVPTLISATEGDLFTLDLNTLCRDFDGHTISYSLFSGSLPGGLTILGSGAPHVLTGILNAPGSFAPVIRASDGFVAVDATLNFTIADSDVTGPTAPVLGTATLNGTNASIPLATPATDASGVLNYQIWRTDDGGVSYQFRQTIIENQFPFAENGLPVGTYQWKSRCRDASLNQNLGSYSAPTNPITVVPISPNPDAPTLFQATPTGATQNTLTWAAGSGPVPDDYDGDFSLNGTGDTGSGPWTPLTIGNQTSFVHTGLTTGVKIYYRLKADKGAFSSGYVYDSATPGVRTLYAAATFEDGTIIAQPSARTGTTARLNSGIFIKAVAKTQGAGEATKWANTASAGTPALFNHSSQGGTELYDVHVQDQETVSGAGIDGVNYVDVVTPREGSFFLRSQCFSGAPPHPSSPRNMGTEKHYEGPNIGGGNNAAHDALKCKPRSEMAWGNNAAYGTPYDTRFWIGISYYVPRSTEAEQQRKGHGSGPQLFENNIPQDADTTAMSMHLVVPESSYINAATGNPVGTQTDLWWSIIWENNPASHIQGGSGTTHVALAPLLAPSNPNSDRGKWTDFVFEVCYNPYTSAQTITGWNFRANTGKLRIWKSSGAVDAQGNRAISEASPIYTRNGTFGLRPRSTTPGDMPGWSWKHYCYWVRSEVPGGSTLTHPIWIGMDCMRMAYAENRTHANAVDTNLVTKYQNGVAGGFSDVCPRA